MPVHWGPILEPDNYASKAHPSAWFALTIVPALTLVLPNLLTRASWFVDPRIGPATWWGSHAVLVVVHAVMCLTVLGAS